MQNNSDKKFSLADLPAKSKIMALAVALMCADICYMLSSTWSTRLDYSFGYLTPIFVLYIIYDRFGRAKDILTSKPGSNNRLLNVFCDFFFTGIGAVHNGPGVVLDIRQSVDYMIHVVPSLSCCQPLVFLEPRVHIIGRKRLSVKTSSLTSYS